jgi:Ca2+/Na+ antiporter
MIDKKIVLLFFFIYFAFQIFAQIWGTYIDKGGIPSGNNYTQNFTTALVLIGLVGYFCNPEINMNNWSSYFVLIMTFVLVFIYCYSKRVLDTQTQNDKANGKNNTQVWLICVMVAIYSAIILGYFITYFSYSNMEERKTVLWSIPILAILYFSFYFFKTNNTYENKFVIPFFLYPVLFLSNNLEKSSILSNGYIIMFVSVVSMWGFFGVEWFVGPTIDYQNNLDTNQCRATLGISDDSMITPDTDTDTKKNTRNINYLYIAISLIFMTIIISVLITFLAFQN